jgi:hypothetical protein
MAVDRLSNKRLKKSDDGVNTTHQFLYEWSILKYQLADLMQKANQLNKMTKH